MRRGFIGGGAILVLSLVLAGCSGDDGSDPDGVDGGHTEEDGGSGAETFPVLCEQDCGFLDGVDHLVLEPDGNPWITYRLLEAGGVFAARYDFDSGQVERQRLDLGATVVFGPDIGVDGQGNVLAAWLEAQKVRWRRRDAATGAWTEPALVFPDTSDDDGVPRLFVASEGTAAVVWDDGQDVIASSYTESGGWGAVTNLELVTATDDPWASGPALGGAVDEAAAIWEEDQELVWGRWADGGWTHGGAVTDRRADAPGRFVATNEQGVIVALWKERTALWGAVYSPSGSTGWRPALELSADTDHGQAIVTNDGAVVVVWIERAQDGTAAVYARRWTLGDGWDPAERLSTSGAAHAETLAAAPSGAVSVLWSEMELQGTKLMHRSLPAGGGSWTAAETLPTGEPFVGSLTSRLAFDAQGRGVVVWWRNVGDTAHSTVFVRRLP